MRIKSKELRFKTMSTLNHSSVHSNVECLNVKDLALRRKLHGVYDWALHLTQLNSPHIEL